MPSSNAEKSRDALASLRINRGEESQSRSGGWWWKILLLLIMLCVGGWFGYQKYGDPTGLLSGDSKFLPEMMQKRVQVRLQSVTVQKGRSADAVVVATGYLESRRQARIGARAAGRIDIITFEEGDRVEKGRILAELEHKDMDASLAASAASVVRAKAAISEQTITIEKALIDRKRAERLWNARSFSRSEYDQAMFAYRSAVARKNSLVADLELARAQKSQAEQLKDNMFIRAPFDGTVISKDAEVGESILPGGMGGGSGRGSVATIADLDHLQIECDVQEDFISRISNGQAADIKVDAVQDKKYHGFVRKILPMGDRARATIKVQVEIKDADSLLFPEMAGTVYFLPEEVGEEVVSDAPRIFCPAKAIVTNDDKKSFVWVVDSKKRAQQVMVTIAETRDGKAEVTDGLQGKERVVVNPTDELSVGAPVEVTQ